MNLYATPGPIVLTLKVALNANVKMAMRAMGSNALKSIYAHPQADVPMVNASFFKMLLGSYVDVTTVTEDWVTDNTTITSSIIEILFVRPRNQTPKKQLIAKRSVLTLMNVDMGTIDVILLPNVLILWVPIR